MSIVYVDSLGTTIENTDTSIWFWCREVVFVTHRFDFMKDYACSLLSTFTDKRWIPVGFLGTSD